MSLERLQVDNIRIIQHVSLQPSPRLNVLAGPNAAGKTSLLEAIDCLSRGRSFRTRLTSSLLRRGAEAFVVSGQVRTPQGQNVGIGMKRSRQDTHLRLGGSPAQSIAALAYALPVRALHPQSHLLIQGPPAYRRAFLDWGVFHVESSFLAAWQRYRKALRQRNAALRQGLGQAAVRAWHTELGSTAAVIDQLRGGYVGNLCAQLKRSLERLLEGVDCELSYRRGWPQEDDLASWLETSMTADRDAGHTRGGPHRAELSVRLDGQPAAEVASRGQQKLLAAALTLAQLNMFVAQTGRSCVCLVDDLPAELDREHRAHLLSALHELDAQLFVTTMEPESINSKAWPEAKVFHVEHGTFTELV